MRRIMAAVAMAASSSSNATAAAAAVARDDNADVRQRRHRGLDGHWVYKPEWPEPEPEPSGKSGKGSKGSKSCGSGKSGCEEPEPEWGWPEHEWPEETMWPEPEPSGKSGKGSKSSSAKPEPESEWGWAEPDWPTETMWTEPEPSGKSGKGSKSSKGSKSCGSGKSGKSGCEEPEPEWGWPEHEWPEQPEPEPSGKSGKGSKSSKGSKSGCGSGKSGKSGCEEPEPVSYWGWGWHAPEPHWGPPAWPDEPEPEPSGKSGKGSKGTKGSKSCKSAKGSKSSKGSKSASGEWVYVMHWVAPPPEKPDSSSPGICAPSQDHGGLECDTSDLEYCSEPGEEAECGSGSTCYDKELCPEFATEDPAGVCGAKGGGLECGDVTTYCTEPGGGGCGGGRECHDAGLCGFSSHGHGHGGYGGVCGAAAHDGGGAGALDCDAVTTMCTEPGGPAECAHGATCYDAGLCDGGKGFCGSEHEYDCEHITTYCDHPGEAGHCPHGQKCHDLDVCNPKEEEPPKEEEVVVEEAEMMLNEICFVKGKIVDCSSWGDDGYGNGDDNDGKAIPVPFTYTVDTDGKSKPEEVIMPMENAILDDVAEYIEGNEEFADFTGKVSAAPDDYIADDDWCGDGHAIRCSVVKGEMTFYPDGWKGDGHDMDPCLAADMVEASMEGNDYTEVDGVTGAKYRNSDDGNCTLVIDSSAATVVEDEDLSAAALFAIWLAAFALIALAFLLLRKRKQAQQRALESDDMSLISNDLNGSMPDFDDPYANTTDVHQCTSKLCTMCNNGLQDTRFLPAPKRVNMKKVIEANEMCMPCDTISPTGVDQAHGDFFNQESKDEDSDVMELPPDIPHQESANTRGSIMRVPFFQAERDQHLQPVNEVAHDSEIDTELESVADDTDQTTVPPPPPLAFHPAYKQRTLYTQRDDDEESV